MDTSEREKQPPASISLRFCPVCGRDDRFTNLPLEQGRHKAPGGKRCPGTVETLRYDFAEQPEDQ
jgi:hypothetical protein